MKPNHDPISTGASVEDDFAVLVEQLIQRSQLQEPIDWTALVEQYPDHKTQLLNLKPTLQALLDLSRSLAQVGTTDGVTNLGKGIPATLGDYRLLGEIGRGGMGIVYEAEQVSLRRRVAVKVLPRSALLDTQRLQRFRNEAIAAATLNHKNIVPIHSVDCEGDLHYYSMQLISGHTLHNVIKCLRERVIPGSSTESNNAGQDFESTVSISITDGSTAPVGTLNSIYEVTYLPTKYPEWIHQVAEWGIELSDGLEHAHQLGVIHRDIKPSNLIVDQQGKIWITDFGLAQLENEPGLTATGNLLGTLRYMSPERVRGEQLASDHLSDIYALGMTLYEMLVFRPAFDAQDRAHLLRQVVNEEPVSLRLLQPRIPTALSLIVEKAIAKIPEDRYKSAAALKEDLLRFLNREPVFARAPSRLQRMLRWAKKHPRLTSTIGSTGVLLLVCTIFGLVAYSKHLSGLAAHRGELNRKIAQLMLDIEHGREQARSNSAEAPLHWAKAKQAASEIEALLATGAADSALAARMDELRDELEAEERDQRLLLDLAASERFLSEGPAITTLSGSVHKTGERDAITQAFVDWGIGPTLQDPERAAGKLLGRREEFLARVAPFLYRWHSLESSLAKSTNQNEIFNWLDALIAITDSDPWRQRLRRLSDGSDVDELVSLASEPEAAEQPAYAMLRLVQLLCKYDRFDDARLILEEAALRHPDSFLLHFEAVRLFNRLRYRREAADFFIDADNEALRHALVAVALRPESKVALNLVQTCLRNATLVHDAELVRSISAGERRVKNQRLLRGLSLQRTQLTYLSAESPGKPHPYVMLPLGLDSERGLKGLEATPASLEHDHVKDLVQQRSFKEARDAVLEMVTQKPDSAKALAMLGYLHLCLGEIDEARSVLARSIELSQDDAIAYVNLSAACAESGDLRAAMRAARKAISLKPEYAEPYLCLADACMRESRFNEAIKLIERGIDIQPGNSIAKLHLADAARLTGKYAMAEQSYLDALRLGRSSPKIYLTLVGVIAPPSDLDQRAEGYTKAAMMSSKRKVTLLEHAIKCYPNQELLHMRAANVYFRELKEAHAAAYHYHRALELDSFTTPQAIGLLRQFSDVLLKLKSRQWIDEYIQLVESKPPLGEAQLFLCELLYDVGDVHSAIAACKRSIEIKPTLGFAHATLGNILALEGSHSEAIAAYRKGLSVNRDDPSLNNTVAWYLATCEDRSIWNYEEALLLATAATSKAPREAGFWNTLGVVHVRGSAWTLAIEALERSMQLNSGGTSYDWFFLAIARSRLGEAEQAQLWYHRARDWMQKNSPDNLELKRFCGEATQILGER